jgi:hypothetical protein
MAGLDVAAVRNIFLQLSPAPQTMCKGFADMEESPSR